MQNCQFIGAYGRSANSQARSCFLLDYFDREQGAALHHTAPKGLSLYEPYRLLLSSAPVCGSRELYSHNVNLNTVLPFSDREKFKFNSGFRTLIHRSNQCGLKV